MTYALLLMHAWQDKETFPGQERLAEELKTSSKSLRVYLNELRNAKLVSWIRRGLTLTNIYIIHELKEFISWSSELKNTRNKPERKSTSDQEGKKSDQKRASVPERKSTSDQERKQASDNKYSDEEYSVEEDSDSIIDRPS